MSNKTPMDYDSPNLLKDPIEDDMPLFLRRNRKDVTPKFIHVPDKDNMPGEPLQEEQGSLLKPGATSDGVIILPDNSKSVDPVVEALERPHNLVEFVRESRFYDSTKGFAMVRRTMRRWNAFKQSWFLYDKEEPEPMPHKLSIYCEGWSAFEGEDFVKLNFQGCLDLCPYEKGTIEASEWLDGWFSGAKWYWNNEFNKPEEDKMLTGCQSLTREGEQWLC